MSEKPNPGSAAAIKLGCACAVIDNHYGAGFGNPPQFWITGGCPVHMPAPKESADV